MQKIVPPDAAFYNAFGAGIALRGDTLVVGAPKRDGKFKHTGAAYVYARRNGTFELEQRLEAPDAAPGDYFGQTVAVDGNTIVVAAPNHAGMEGAAYVFIRRDGAFRFEQKLASAHPRGGMFFGFSLSLRGDAAAVGEPGGYADVGRAHVFLRHNGAFVLQKEIVPERRRLSDGEPDFLNFGYAVSIEDRSLFVGAYYYIDSAGSGLVYVFTKDGGVWTERQVLRASDRSSDDGFGRSLARAGANLLVGGNSAVYVFTPGEDGWLERQRLALPLPLDVAAAGDDLAIAFGGHVLQRRDGVFGLVQRVDPSDQKPHDLNAWHVHGRQMYAPRTVAADVGTLVLAVPSDAGRGAVFVIGGEP